ncbi:SDR family oxidoreductase [Palleronia sp. LCG004]|uniref:SDR family oxidoreductase n=1 Tax=Palleronia sp. LCG004 TaxID=3079304 RepID=UPI00294229A6|nr:SDR family oxidoreductase [Palleronia sp. LCG004]WOI55543.1 SDR family oxidoreductase [Palleronia sp. LCG004]
MPGKSAIVCGGSAGIGRAIVSALVDRGYRVGVIARGRDRLEAMAEDPNIATAAADVSDAAALEAAIEALVAEIGTPSVWINSAMLTVFAPFEEVSAEEFARIVDVTFIGQVNGTRLALKHMKAGNIVNVGSGLGYRPVPLQSAYCAAKHAINGFTGSLRSELMRDGRPIALSMVQLPAVNSPQFDWAINRLEKRPQPAPPIYRPDLAARAVMRAIDEDAREIFVGSSVLKLVLPNFLLPGWLDRKMSTSGVSAQKSATDEPGNRPGNLWDPVSYAPRAEGSFGDRAKADGIIVDADLVRKLTLAALVGVPLIVGLILGMLIG